MSVDVCPCMRRPEISLGGHSLEAIHLDIEPGSITRTWRPLFRPGYWPVSPQDLPDAACQVLGLQVCLTMPGCLCEF